MGRHIYKHLRQVFAVGLLAFGLAGCGPDGTLMSEADEAKVGAREHAKIIKAYGGVYDDPELGVYVAGVALRIAQASEKPDATYHVTVLDSPIVNAFALPGGYIYVTRGLLALANSEAELAAVLAHEIAHVTARHGARRHTQHVGTTIFGAVLAATLNMGTYTSDLINLGADALLAGYSRKHEYEADKLSVETLQRAGYDMRGTADFLAAIGAHAEFTAQLQGRSTNLPDWFSTHPNTDDRVTRAAALAETLQQNITGEQSADIGRDAYLAAIDGLPYTEDPAAKKQDQTQRLKIAIVTVGTGDNMASFAARIHVSREPEAHFRMLNGYAPSDVLQSGQKVKLVVAD